MKEADRNHLRIFSLAKEIEILSCEKFAKENLILEKKRELNQLRLSEIKLLPDFKRYETTAKKIYSAFNDIYANSDNKLHLPEFIQCCKAVVDEFRTGNSAMYQISHHEYIRELAKSYKVDL